MNINDLTTFVMGLASGSLGLAIFVMVGRIIIKKKQKPVASVPPVKTSAQPRFNRRRKVETNPNIICLLPAFTQKRPEQRLW